MSSSFESFSVVAEWCPSVVRTFDFASEIIGRFRLCNRCYLNFSSRAKILLRL